MGIKPREEVINIDIDLRIIYVMVKGNVLWVDALPGERTSRENRKKQKIVFWKTLHEWYNEE